MKIRYYSRWIACVAAGLFCVGLGASPARAVISCTASSAGLAFGVYNVLAPSATDATGTVTVTCTGDAEPANSRILHLSSGGSGNLAARRMASGANLLSYQIYTTSARTIVWGDGSNGTGAVTLMVGIPGSASATLYGRVTALQSKPPGSYLDTIIVTVNF